MIAQEAAEAAFAVAGSPFPLREVPKPTDVPAEDRPSVHPVTDADLVDWDNIALDAQEWTARDIHESPANEVEEKLYSVGEALMFAVKEIRRLNATVKKLREGRA